MNHSNGSFNGSVLPFNSWGRGHVNDYWFCSTRCFHAKEDAIGSPVVAWPSRFNTNLFGDSGVQVFAIGIFKQKRKKKSVKTTGRQADFAQAWDTEIKANYAKAKELANKAASM